MKTIKCFNKAQLKSLHNGSTEHFVHARAFFSLIFLSNQRTSDFDNSKKKKKMGKSRVTTTLNVFYFGENKK
jgi:phosphoribosylaminoimidazole-succinocarboxamide synthase